MTKIPVTFISSTVKLKPSFMLPEPIEVRETHQVKSHGQP